MGHEDYGLRSHLGTPLREGTQERIRGREGLEEDIEYRTQNVEFKRYGNFIIQNSI